MNTSALLNFKETGAVQNILLLSLFIIREPNPEIMFIVYFPLLERFRLDVSARSQQTNISVSTALF